MVMSHLEEWSVAKEPENRFEYRPFYIVYSLTRLGFTKQRKFVVYVCTETNESKPVKLETSYTVILPHTLSVLLCFGDIEKTSFVSNKRKSDWWCHDSRQFSLSLVTLTHFFISSCFSENKLPLFSSSVTRLVDFWQFERHFKHLDDYLRENEPKI